MNKNVLFGCESSTFQVQLATYLQEKYHWKPVFWLGSDSDEYELRKRFPNIIFQDFDTIQLGMPAKDLKDEKLVVDVDVLRQLYKYEPYAIKMINRKDLSNRMTYEERKDLYLFYVKYWTNVLCKYEIDILLFHEMPHEIFSYTLYAVAIEQNRNVLFYRQTSLVFQGYSYLLFSHKNEKIASFYIEQYEEITSNTNLDIPVVFRDYYNKITQNSYENAVPQYMKDQYLNRSKEGIVSYLKSRFKQIRDKSYRDYVLWAINPFSPEYIQRKNLADKYYDSSKVHVPKHIRKYWNSRKICGAFTQYYTRKRKTNKLEKEYFKITNTFDKDKKYIYLALHYQPERTSLPEGDIFENQLIIIDLIANSLPEGWVLYIKEHPSQFMYYMRQSRRIDFYQQAMKYNCVQFLSLKTPNFELIDHAQCIATITGTVGWEAINRGVPALVFGYPWYQMCEGVFQINNNQGLNIALEKIRSGYQISQHRLIAFWHFMEQCALSFDYNKYHINNQYDTDSIQDVKTYGDYIQMYYQNSLID